MCNDYVLEKEEYKNHTIKIVSDFNPDNPRNWDNLGTIICVNHRRYSLGDEQTDYIPERLENERLAVLLPIYMYEHSGIALSTGNQYPFNDLFDSGCIGVIFVNRETVLKEYGWKKITPERKAKLVKYLQSEIEVYSSYLNGDVYGYQIENEEGEELDSCYGFYGWDDVMQEAKSQVDWYANEAQKEQDELNSRIMEVC